MRTILFISLIFTMASVVFASETSKLRWVTDYEYAQTLSEKTGRTILANFTGSDWCIWCKRLKKEVFTQPEFQKYAKENLILLEVDFPSKSQQPRALKKQNRKLSKKYNIKGFPTILLLDSKGKVLARTGYRRGGARAYVQHLENLTNDQWLTNFEKAKQLSRRTGKPILADFTGSDWCIWCIRLDKEVFSKTAFQKYADRNLVLLKIDFPTRKKQPKALQKQNQKLAKKYKIQGYPTVLLLDHKGRVIAKTGYRKGGPGAYIKHLEKLLGRSTR